MQPSEVTQLIVAAGVVPVTGGSIDSARELVRAGLPVVAIDADQVDVRDLDDGIRSLRSVGEPAVIGLKASALPGGLDDHVDFLLAGGFDELPARACHRAGTAYVPRVRSPQELAVALELNVGLVATTGPTPVSVADVAEAHGPRWLGRYTESDDGLRRALTAGVDCFELDLSSRDDPDGRDPVEIVGLARACVREARAEPLYGAIEHVGIYATAETGVDTITSWYGEVFGLPTVARRTSFIGRGVYGRIEALAEPQGERCHLAVRVRDFDAAVADLSARGYALEAFSVSQKAKLAYLRDRDPVGNLVHIMWRP
jgi:hypothetical protein